MIDLADLPPHRIETALAPAWTTDWITQEAINHGGFDVRVSDLREMNLPLMDEPNHPRLGRYTHDHTKAWSATISRGDAYLIVLPEYNYSFSGPLKNALDYLSQEWAGKPVALASYGGISGGLRAATALSPVLGALGLVTARAAIAIPWVRTHVEHEAFVGYEAIDASIDAVYAELVRLHDLLTGD